MNMMKSVRRFSRACGEVKYQVEHNGIRYFTEEARAVVQAWRRLAAHVDPAEVPDNVVRLDVLWSQLVTLPVGPDEELKEMVSRAEGRLVVVLATELARWFFALDAEEAAAAEHAKAVRDAESAIAEAATEPAEPIAASESAS